MNVQQMMKQAQSMQKKMQELQKIMSDKEIVGTAGGDAVVVTISGKGDIKSIKISESIVKPEEKEVIEDLIIAAFNNAKQSLEEYSNGEMNKLGISPEMMKGFI